MPTFYGNSIVFFDDFEDGLQGDWIYTGIRADRPGLSVVEQNGYLALTNDVTDQGGRVHLDLATSLSQFTIDTTYYLNPGNGSGSDYFLPRWAMFLATADGGLLTVDFRLQNSSWQGDYRGDIDNYDRPRITYNIDGGTRQVDFVDEFNSSEFYNAWHQSRLYFDGVAGTFGVDVDFDGISDWEIQNNAFIGAQLDAVEYDAYGWFTGHTGLIDEVTIYGTEGVAVPAPPTAAELQQDGYLYNMALFARAAYTLAEWELDEAVSVPGFDDNAQLNVISQGSSDILDIIRSNGWVGLSYQQLGLQNYEAVDQEDYDIFGGPDAHFIQGELSQSGDGFRSWFEDGIYTHENAAALVFRSADSIVISIRGTNDGGAFFGPASYDRDDWNDRSEHYDHLAPLFERVIAYATEQGIGDIFLTGHSLGAGIVDAFMQLHPDTNDISYRAVTFASPGYRLFANDDPDGEERTIAFLNENDAIRLARIVSDDYGDLNQIYFPELIEGTSESESGTQHSMALYLAILDLARQSGVPDAYLFWNNDGIDFDEIVTDFTDVNPDNALDNLFTVGDGPNHLQRVEQVNIEGELFEIPLHQLFLGGEGNDTIIDNMGDDAVFAGTGDDYMIAGFGVDYYDGGTHVLGDFIDFQDATGFVSINLNANLIFSDGFGSVEQIFNVEHINGSSQNDYLVGDNGANEIRGAEGNDTIHGLDGNDILVGERWYNSGTSAGTDYIYGGDGDDIIAGDYYQGIGTPSASDYLFGDAGEDTMYGQGGNDFMWGGDDNDTMHGGDDHDWLRGEGGLDTLFGDAGDDVLIGGSGNDEMNGGTGTDTFYGEGDNDTINGGANGDVAFGQDGDDIINGGSGGDFLFGGTGMDTINGGADNDLMWGDYPTQFDGDQDIFDFDLGWGFDSIFGFELGIDEINMGGIAGLTQFSDLTVYDGGANVTVAFGADAITLYGVTLAQLNANQGDFSFV